MGNVLSEGFSKVVELSDIWSITVSLLLKTVSRDSIGNIVCVDLDFDRQQVENDTNVSFIDKVLAMLFEYIDIASISNLETSLMEQIILVVLGRCDIDKVENFLRTFVDKNIQPDEIHDQRKYMIELVNKIKFN